MDYTKKTNLIAAAWFIIAMLFAILLFVAVILTIANSVSWIVGREPDWRPSLGLLSAIPMFFFAIKSNKYFEKVAKLDAGLRQSKSLVPNQELIDFADDFSKAFKIFPAGTYNSRFNNYEILYHERNEKQSDFIAARVSNISGIIGLYKHDLISHNFTVDGVFYLIIWCWFRQHVNSEMDADRYAIKWYLATNRPMVNMIWDQMALFRAKPTTLNIERYQKILKYIDQFD